MALSTTVLAVLAAIASLLSGQQPNEAVMDQIEAPNQWNYESVKLRIMMLIEGRRSVRVRGDHSAPEKTSVLA